VVPKVTGFFQFIEYLINIHQLSLTSLILAARSFKFIRPSTLYLPLLSYNSDCKIGTGNFCRFTKKTELSTIQADLITIQLRLIKQALTLKYSEAPLYWSEADFSNTLNALLTAL